MACALPLGTLCGPCQVRTMRGTSSVISLCTSDGIISLLGSSVAAVALAFFHDGLRFRAPVG